MGPSLFQTTVLLALGTLFGGVRGQMEGSGSLLVPFPTEEPTSQSDGSGSGLLPPIEGSGGLEPDHIICPSSTNQITVSLFETLTSAVGKFGCRLVTENNNSTGLLFTIEVQGMDELLLTEVVGDMLFVDLGFSPGVLEVMVTVCTEEGNEECDGTEYQDLDNVTITIVAHRDRLFPYGDALDDESFRDVLDGAVPIVAPERLPFYSNYYNTLYVSSNGLVSLNQPFISWWPIPFPYGRTPTPIIAPYWTDLDFRNQNRERSKVYYNTYTEGDGSLRGDEILRLFVERLDSYAGGAVEFEPLWLTVVTWNEATPYYWRYYTDQTVTFQLVLATDYISTYAFYLYPSGGFNTQLPRWRRVVVGSDPKDYKNYNNVILPNGTLYTMIDRVSGNTGELGQWYFNFTSPESEADSEQLCLEWDREQRKINNTESFFGGLSACPCTRRQAQRDWRFWFAHFWGLSSRSNCATFLWSGRQTTIECCYDDEGSLLVGPSAGGSYLLYNPLFRFQDHFLNDRRPYQHCCENSDRCNLFFTHRPSDNCSNYNPPRRFFIFGDPHFKSIDNRNFTFNGIGEYLLLESQTNDLSMQARLEQFEADTAGTVTTAILLQESSSPPVQVNAESGSFSLYVSGNKTALPGTGSAIVVDSTGVMDVSDVSTVSVSMSMEQVFVRREDNNGVDTLVITTPSGASLSVTIENGFLGIAVELSNNFRNKTRGLLGVFNGDVNDDFTVRNGTVLDITEEKDIYQFGLDWHVSEEDSLFSYGDQNYSALNNDYLDFIPTFFDELNITQEVMDACGDNQACILDASVTGNVNIGTSTLQEEKESEELGAILDNKPPTIAGDFVLYVDTMQSVSTTYTVEEPDGDEIANITVQGTGGTGIMTETVISDSTGTLELTWASPGYDVPSEEIRIFASDKSGAFTSRRISIVLCGCMNNGNCSDLANTDLFNAQGHHKLMCLCPLFFGGDSCEIDMRGCGFDVCPDYAVCMNDSSVASGYTCSNCSEGYQVIAVGDENKCSDIDECNLTTSNNCSQVCTNTEGSYTCACETGYLLSTDSVSCEDVDECLEGTDDCDQICSNTNGSFACSCFSGYTLNSMTNECDLVTCSSSGLCDSDTDCTEPTSGQFQCVCPAGQMCSGACSGSSSEVESGSQTCQDCPSNSYGVDCMETCNCMNGGTCDRVKGCVCTEGTWTGRDCSIEVNNYDPVFVESSLTLTSPIRWDLPANSLVATVVANDDDTNPRSGRVAYSLVKPQYQLSSGISDGLDFFEINENTGAITNREDLGSVYNQHRFTSFVLTISASDRGERPRSSQATVSIVPLSVPVLPDSIGVITVSENTVIGTAVFDRFNCAELGPSSGSLTLTLNSSLPGPFMIEPDNSSLAVARLIDFENLMNPVFNLEVICTNRHQVRDTLRFQVEIENLDDNPFEFDMLTYSVEILENTTADTVVLTVRASDLDSPDAAVQYSVITGFPEFHLHQSNGEIRVTSVGLDRETRDTFSLQVRAELINPGINSPSTTTANVTITLIDINDNTPYFVPSDVYIDEVFSDGQVGDLVLTVVAMDDDIGSNGEVRYELEANDYFEINETSGEIRVKGPLTPDTSLILSVNASDRGDSVRRAAGQVLVYIRPSPERLQFGQNRYVFNVTENDSRGVRLGSIDAVILDVLNSTFNESSEHSVEYEIVSGTAEPFFIISRQTGEIYLLTSLDYETAHEYDFIVRAVLTSDRNISKDVVVQVLVENLNDNAPQFSASFYTDVVEELTPAGTAILTVSAIDLDEIDSANITFRLDGILSGDPFEIDQTSGVISSAQRLLNIRDYRFSVIASDGELESTVVVFISVTRSSSVSPTFTREKYIFNISENTQPGSYVGTVVVLTNGSISSDRYPHLGFRIFSPDSNGSLFYVDEKSGDISTLALAEFDAESQLVLVFYVEVFNVDSPLIEYDSATIEVHLADVNDNGPVFLQSLYTRVINTSQPVNSAILTVSANDIDIDSMNSQIEYSIATGPLGFALDSTTGDLSVTNSTSIPGQYYLTVVATDNGMPQMNGTATVYVAILPDTPERIEFNQSTYYFNVTENATLGILVGTVQAFDSSMISTLENLIYSTPNVTQCFTLDETDGEIRVSCRLDREAAARYELELVASITDGEDTVRGYSTVVIDILDINDNAPVFNLDVYAAVIDDNYGNNTILQVSATDRDVGSNADIEYDIKDPPGMLNQATPYFTIEPSSGNLSLARDVVPIGDYRLIAFATDKGSDVRMSSTAVILICITRSQPAQIVFATRHFQIQENVPPGTHVGTIVLTSGIQVIEPSEFSNNLQFRWISGSRAFSLNTTGDIFTTGMLDREMSSSHTITVIADFVRFGISQIASISITVLDQNDVRPEFLLSTYSHTIDDNAAMGSDVLGITTIDYDLGDNSKVTFSIQEKAGLPFDVSLDGFIQPFTRGQIFVSDTTLLIPNTYVFTVVGTDNGTPRLNTTTTVNIIVVHALPAVIFFPTEPYVFNHTENAPTGMFVGNISVVQETPALNGLTYQITGGNDGYFHLDALAGTLTNARVVNRELNSSFTLTIEAHLPRAPHLSAETTVTVNVLDLNDEVPAFTNGGTYATTIFANEVTLTSSLITVEAIDDDEGRNADIQFSIFAGNDLNLFSIDQTGAIFANVVPLNVSTYVLSVTARDMGDTPLSSNATVTITIQNTIPENINFLQQDGYDFSINENSDFTLPIGQVSVEAIQPDDLRQYLRYSLVPNTFRIDSQGVIRSTGALDYEVAHNHTLIVTATLDIPIHRFTPKVTLTRDVQVIIFVNDLNDNDPVFVDFPYNVEQLEERGSEELVATVTATDADSGSNQQLMYVLLNSDTSVTSQFRVDPGTGELFAGPDIDRETQELYVLLIRVCDMGDNPRQNCIEAAINFTLLDINDNSPRLTSGTVYEVRERVPAGTEAFIITAEDPDAGAFGSSGLRFLFFSLFGSSGTSYGNTAVFRENEQTGVVTLLEELDYEREPFYTATIRIRDNWFGGVGGGLRADLGVRINVIDEPDNTPQFSSPEYSVMTDPMLTRDLTVLEVVATDDDLADVLSYHIISVLEEGNNGTPPSFAIDRASGRVYLTEDQVFVPEARFTLSLKVYDNSQFNLSADATLIVTIRPETLQFEQDSYNIVISEGVGAGSELVRLPIRQLSVSSQINYILDVTDPLNQAGIFSLTGSGGPEAIISLAEGRQFDREAVDQYTMMVTAQRSDPDETATTMLVITIGDENDNSPIFIDGENPVIFVEEEIASQTQVAMINVTDRDIGDNGRIRYEIVNAPIGFPFAVDEESGILRVIGDIDYEEVQNFSMNVLAQDYAISPLSSMQTYVIQVVNINDNFPQFAAPAYFGEVYAEAQANDIVHHIVLTVTDADDVNNQQQLSFNIYFSDMSSVDARAGYAFEVTEEPPYRIRVVNLPDLISTTPKQLFLRVSVSDSDHSTNVHLFIYIFLRDNLIIFNLNGVGVSKRELESCANQPTSLCEFLNILGDVVTSELSDSVFFNNHSLVDSGTEMVTLQVYGWYGSEYNHARGNDGELASQDPLTIRYLFYSSNTQTFTAALSNNQLERFNFGVDIEEMVTETPSPEPEDNMLIIIIAIVCGVLLSALCIILIIVVVCVLSRKRDEPRRKRTRKQSDPYLRAGSRSNRKRRTKSRRSSLEEFALTSRGESDLAYETMYGDDDEMLDSNQTMPWFDPKYLAGNEQYDGDNERTQRGVPRVSKGGPVRATVDGNARRQRRYSSDESAAAESATEMENYLDQYQQSPMQPGQRMGEYDMFARPPDSDRPFRPSLEEYQWNKRQN